VRDLGDLKLKAPQRDALRKLRAESDAKVANAKRDLDRAEAQLQKAIENVNASDADIARAIDAVAQQEATIRKARILTWVNARRMLDDSQRQKVEGAARKGRTR
jgi:multidrug resistance efflux pump